MTTKSLKCMLELAAGYKERDVSKNVMQARTSVTEQCPQRLPMWLHSTASLSPGWFVAAPLVQKQMRNIKTGGAG